MLVQELETIFPASLQPTPAEIAREALQQLDAFPRVADGVIKVVEDHGWLRLEGNVNSQLAREDAVRRLRGIRGSRGVIDKLRILDPAAVEVAGD